MRGNPLALLGCGAINVTKKFRRTLEVATDLRIPKLIYLELVCMVFCKARILESVSQHCFL